MFGTRWTLVGLLLVLSSPALAQEQSSRDIPRTADGLPDFQGAWESRWRTPFERPESLSGPTMTAEQAAAYQAQEEQEDIKADMSPPDDSEYGTFMPAGDGLFRTSLIVEPASGMLPLTEAAKTLRAEWGARRTVAAGPEDRSPSERCLPGPGRAPMPITPANMFRRIVQTPDHVVVFTEDRNDVRVIAINAEHKPAEITSDHGDSVAHWDGDALMIETTNYAATRGGVIVGPQSVVTERMSMITADEISYEFTVTDAAFYSEPWRAQYILRRTDVPMWEGSCHEGNYALANILLATRLGEMRGGQSNAQAGTSKQP